MKITEEVKEAMEQKSVEFLKSGAEIYVKQEVKRRKECYGP